MKLLFLLLCITMTALIGGSFTANAETTSIDNYITQAIWSNAIKTAQTSNNQPARAPVKKANKNNKLIDEFALDAQYRQKEGIPDGNSAMSEYKAFAGGKGYNTPDVTAHITTPNGEITSAFTENPNANDAKTVSVYTTKDSEKNIPPSLFILGIGLMSLVGINKRKKN